MDRAMLNRFACRLFGHKRESYVGGYYVDRWGRERQRTYRRCTRCGTSDGAEVYSAGLMERLTWWQIKMAWRGLAARYRTENCTECGKPFRRLGHPVGNHQECDDGIPF